MNNAIENFLFTKKVNKFSLTYKMLLTVVMYNITLLLPPA